MNQTKWATRSIFLAFGLALSSWAPMVPFAKERLELDDAQLGMILFLFGLGALSTMPLTGWLIHRLGSRSMTVMSCLCVASLLPMLALADSPLALSLVLFLFGATTGAMNVAINAQAVAVEKASGSAIMSGFHCLFSTGGLFGALIVTALLEFNWPLVACALIISAGMLLLVIAPKKYLIASQENAQAKQKFGFPPTSVIFLGMICFISFMAEGSMLDWSAEFLRSEKEFDPSLAGIGYALFSIAMAFGRLVGDRCIRNFSALSVFQVGSFLVVCGFVLVVCPQLSYGSLVGFGLIGLGASNIVPILFTASGKIPQVPASHSLTLTTTMGYAGGLMGPAFIGFLAEATSLSIGLASMGVCFILVGFSASRILAIPSVEQEIT